MTNPTRKLKRTRQKYVGKLRSDPFDLFIPAEMAPITEELIAETMARFPESSKADIQAQLERVAADTIFINGRYQVNISDLGEPPRGWPAMLSLSIRRRDKARVGPEKYRDFMAIKDRLVGPENEAVEVYPARSREYDMANQYWLFVLKEPGVRFPFGFNFGKRVVGGDVGGGAGEWVQHPFDEPQHRGVE